MSIYYQDDLVTVYHGDCREHTQWLDADVLVTDPPYGVKWTSGVTYYRRTKPRVKAKTAPIAGDGDTSVRDEVLDSWGDKPSIVFGSWRSPRPARVDHRLIWHKKGQAPGPANSAFMSQDEEIYVAGSGFRKSSPPLRSVIATTEARAIEVAKIGHPTPKPVGLMETLIDRCPTGVIADPFAGSGATLLAAVNLGRKVIGVEFEEQYCELIAKRLASQTSTLDFGEVTA